ncbi:MAG TPA: serine/threonine-protein kinase [Ktedonobacteraceae bacterium]
MISQIPVRQQYQIVGQVGEGSAVVYQAWTDKAGLPQTVALKVTTVGRALHEARILASLQHPNIPRFYDLVVDDTEVDPEAYVVMEFIEGETLAQYLESYLAQGELPPVQQVLDIGIQLCAILDYLHAQQPALTFRDVKPENVMLSADGRLVLIDFDAACAYGAMWDTDFPVAGTPGYMAPELLADMPSFSPLSDVYGLGATLYHLLTGHRPSMDMREATQDRAFGRLPRQVRQALLWMTEPDPRCRPADMGSVRMVLEQVLLSLRMSNTLVNWLKSIPIVLRKFVAEGDGPMVPCHAALR